METERQTDGQKNGQADRTVNGRMDITKLIFVCQNFAIVPINNGETGETGSRQKN